MYKESKITAAKQRASAITLPQAQQMVTIACTRNVSGNTMVTLQTKLKDKI
jgi:hypothetical protein